MIRLIITGIEGRMGSRISTLAHKAKDLQVAATTKRGEDFAAALAKGEVVIDFTAPEASVRHARMAAEKGLPLVIGTTGFSDQQMRDLQEASSQVPIVSSPNMSIGVNVLFALDKIAAQALGRHFKIEIVETHHAQKKDKPSGTAKHLLKIIEEACGVSQDQITVRSIREGEVVGDHTVHFTSCGETLHLTHHAISRDIFAEGALVAARWIVGKKSGLYSMHDVLNIHV